jgi:hypothetical protein
MNKTNSFEETISKALRDLPVALPQTDLADRIILAVLKKKQFYVSVRLSVYSCLAFLSCISCVVAWNMESSNILNSKLIELLNLLFSDFRVVATYWREYALSVAEALPIFSIFFVALSIWFAIIFLWKTILAGNLFMLNRSAKQLKF